MIYGHDPYPWKITVKGQLVQKIGVETDGQTRPIVLRSPLTWSVIIWHIAAVKRHFSALTLLVWRQEGHLACKKTEWWGAGVVICLERGADLHMAQLMPLLLTVSCSSKIQTDFTFLVPAHPRSLGQRTVKRMCVCVCCSEKQWGSEAITWMTFCGETFISKLCLQ